MKGNTTYLNEIRSLVMKGKSQQIKALILNKKQVKLVKLVDKRRTLTAKELAKEYGIGTSNASLKLRRLASIGYIKRVKAPAKKGGREFIYISQDKRIEDKK